MATNFPASLDTLTNPTSSDSLSSPSHSAQHANVNDAVEAIEAALLDGAPLHIDDANERVGVGNVSPSYKLDVTGDINASGDLRIGGTAIGEYVDYSGSQTFGAGLTVGNGTITSKYCRVNNFVHFWGQFALGSTSAVTGVLDINLPIASAAGLTQSVGNSTLSVAGNYYIGTLTPLVGSAVRVQWQNATGTAVYFGDVTATNPGTWATSHFFTWNYVYQAA